MSVPQLGYNSDSTSPLSSSVSSENENQTKKLHVMLKYIDEEIAKRREKVHGQSTFLYFA